MSPRSPIDLKFPTAADRKLWLETIAFAEPGTIVQWRDGAIGIEFPPHDHPENRVIVVDEGTSSETRTVSVTVTLQVDALVLLSRDLGVPYGDD